MYESVAGNLTFFLQDGSLYMGNYTDQRPIELLIGPTADDEAPNGFTGKYAKTWKETRPERTPVPFGVEPAPRDHPARADVVCKRSYYLIGS